MSILLFRKSLVQRAITILRRLGVLADLKLTAVTTTSATSVGPVTIPEGGSVEVLPNKTWSIV